MPCYHPNLILQDRDRYNKNTGKGWQKVGFINSWSKDFKGYEYYDQFNDDPERSDNGRYRYMRAPCYNKCIGCCESLAQEWALRCTLESMEHEENYMITLTYNDEWLPVTNEIQVGDQIYYDDGSWNSYIRYSDFEKFQKDLQNHQAYNFGIRGIKKFGCGEYGGEGNRAHGHIMEFGMHIPPGELKVQKVTPQGIIYKCEMLEEIWDHKGFVSVTECNYMTCRYVAGYVQKKNIKSKRDQYEFYTNKEAYYARRGQTPEKNFMTKGIGQAAYEKNKQSFFEDGYILINGAHEQILPAKIPRIYDRWLERECEPMYEKVKDERKEKAIKANKVKMSMTSLTLAEQLKVEERTKQDKMDIFKNRDGIK